MTAMDLSRISVVMMAWRRPYYLRETLGAWSRVRGISDVRTLAIAKAEHPPTRDEQSEIISAAAQACGRPIETWPDSPLAVQSTAGHRAIGEAFQRAFSDSGTDFVVYGEEDVLPSSDVLEYMAWGASEFEGDSRVLAVCAHPHIGYVGAELGIDEADADPALVRLRPRFAGWICGVWRNRFTGILEPTWDWDCTSGGPADPAGQGPAGWDHNVTRVMRSRGLLCAVPDASRSQNIGEWGGTYANPADFPATQVASFREHRDPISYQVVSSDEGSSVNVVTSDGLRWMVDGAHTDDHIGPSGHEANLEPLLRGLLGKDRLFLDVGAHVGRWALRLAGQASHVIAVEANPVTAVVLRENIRLNGLEEKVTVLEVAAWDCRASLRLEDPNGKVRGASTRVLPGGEETVAVALDEALNLTGQDLGLVKLDVEGADLQALRGMRQLLTEHRPSMLVERHDQYGFYAVEDLYELLASLGYEWTDGPEYGGAKYLICQPAETPGYVPKANQINLGCGSLPMAGWTNVDLVPLPGVDVVHDLDVFPWPFEDGQVSVIRAFDVFEHVDKPLEFMNECWRVLRDGGLLMIHTGHWQTENAYTDPTHKRFCTERTFDYWCVGNDLFDRYGPAYNRGCTFRKVDIHRDGQELAAQLVKLPKAEPPD